MNPPFVKKFDFRGKYGEDINDSDAYYLALAIEKTIGLKKILIGWDTRASSKNLALSFMSAIEGKNIEVSYLDACPIDYVTAAANEFDFDLSVMFTGSHNPWTWTGLLMHTKGGVSVDGQLVTDIVENYNKAKTDEYIKKEINLSNHVNFYEQIEKVYLEKLISLIAFDKIKNLKVLVDIGDGSGSRAISLIKKYLPQVEFVLINDRHIYDDKSPHIADPSEIKNMEQLIDEVKKNGYDCGFAFDSDADRVLAVDENGKYINGSLLGSAHIETFINLSIPDSDFGYAVDCGPSMKNCVSDFNKNGLNIFTEPIPVGRSRVRKLIQDGKIDFGVENVGHFYSNDFFMTDSGTFSMIIILYWMGQNGKLSNLFNKYPDGFREQVFSSVLGDEETNSLINSINGEFKNYEIKKIDKDGVRFEFILNGKINTWYAIRKSGYESITKTYYGSLDEKDFGILKSKFSEIVKK